MGSKIGFWLKFSRAYTLPMSFFSWLIIFSYGMKNHSNAFYGILALVGILICHLATNLFDDYTDFKSLKKVHNDGKLSLPNTQRGKCLYLINKTVTHHDVAKVILVYLFIAFLIGLFFVYELGYTTLIYMIIASVIILFYSKMSNLRLSEAIIAIAFGPLLFSATYFVMSSQVEPKAVILSVPSMIFTINLIYTDTLMDYDIDKEEGKKTFVGLFSKETALKIQVGLLGLGYLSLFLLNKTDTTSKLIFIAFLTLPLALDLIKSNYYYIKGLAITDKKWYHFPFEDWKDIEENRSPEFMFRMYQARNLMIYTSILITLAIVL